MQMEQECIQCDGSECWMHQHCIGLSMSQYVKFSEPHLQFFCRCYIGNGDVFNCLSSLSRIAAHAPDLNKMTDQAKSELNLLHFYNVTLPHVQYVEGEFVISPQTVG